MPKLTIRHPDPAGRRPAEKPATVPPARPCPRCRIILQSERTYLSKGLSGRSSLEHIFRCPACDARYHYAERTGRWRELTDE